MDKIIEVIQPGTEVEIIQLMKIGLITGVYIRENNISYDVVLWRDNVRSEINVNSFEVVPKSDDKLKIGFTNGGDS